MSWKEHGLHTLLIAAAAILVTAWLAAAAPPGPVPIPGHSGSEIAPGSVTGDKLADNLVLTGNASINSPTFVVSGGNVIIGGTSPLTGTSDAIVSIIGGSDSLIVEAVSGPSFATAIRALSPTGTAIVASGSIFGLFAQTNSSLGSAVFGEALHPDSFSATFSGGRGVNVFGDLNVTGNLSVGSGTAIITTSGMEFTDSLAAYTTSGIVFPDGTVQTTAANGAGVDGELEFTEVTASCDGKDCFATATCPTGKKIAFGITRTNGAGCDTDPSKCTGYCTPDEMSCTTMATGTKASVYISCGGVVPSAPMPTP